MVIVFLRELAWWKAASIWTMSVALILTIVTAHSISIYPPRRWQATIHVKYPPFRMTCQVREGWPFMVSRQQIGTTKGFSFHTTSSINYLAKYFPKSTQIHLQGVPTSLEYAQNCLRAKRASFTKKIVFCSKKLLFEPFLPTARNDNGFLKQLFSNFKQFTE